MTIEFDNTILNTAQTASEPDDYTGADGLLYCGKCHKAKEAYFTPDKAVIFGRDRHPADCDCQRQSVKSGKPPRNAAATLTWWRI